MIAITRALGTRKEKRAIRLRGNSARDRRIYIFFLPSLPPVFYLLFVGFSFPFSFYRRPARTGFLCRRYKGGVTSDAPRKFISRFNAAALLALIYIHSPKPRTASGTRPVTPPDTGYPFIHWLDSETSGPRRRVAATNEESPTRLIKTGGACRVLLEALIFFISCYLEARRTASSNEDRRERRLFSSRRN